jgi:hypothetical protein
MEKIVKYKIFNTSEEFENFQEKNQVIIYSIFPVYTNSENIKNDNFESVTNSICVLVTYCENS